MEEMNDKELVDFIIREYVNLQRIKKYGKEEIEYQEKVLKNRLSTFGISTEDLELKMK